MANEESCTSSLAFEILQSDAAAYDADDEDDIRQLQLDMKTRHTSGKFINWLERFPRCSRSENNTENHLSDGKSNEFTGKRHTTIYREAEYGSGTNIKCPTHEKIRQNDLIECALHKSRECWLNNSEKYELTQPRFRSRSSDQHLQNNQAIQRKSKQCEPHELKYDKKYKKAQLEQHREKVIQHDATCVGLSASCVQQGTMCIQQGQKCMQCNVELVQRNATCIRHNAEFVQQSERCAEQETREYLQHGIAFIQDRPIQKERIQTANCKSSESKQRRKQEEWWQHRLRHKTRQSKGEPMEPELQSRYDEQHCQPQPIPHQMRVKEYSINSQRFHDETETRNDCHEMTDRRQLHVANWQSALKRTLKATERVMNILKYQGKEKSRCSLNLSDMRIEILEKLKLSEEVIEIFGNRIIETENQHDTYLHL